MAQVRLTAEMVMIRFSQYLSPMLKVPAEKIFPPALAAFQALEKEGLECHVEGADLARAWEIATGKAPVAVHDPGSEMSGAEPKFNDV